MRDLDSHDIATAAKLARDHEPFDNDRPRPAEYADDAPRRRYPGHDDVYTTADFLRFAQAFAQPCVNGVVLAPKGEDSGAAPPGGTSSTPATSSSCAAETTTSEASPGGALRSSQPSAFPNVPACPTPTGPAHGAGSFPLGSPRHSRATPVPSR